jgi:hemolysin III
MGAIIYGISVTLLYLFSCLYHALGNNNAKWKVFKRFDHISIYLLIGGTYAPILLGLSTLNYHVGNSGLTMGMLIFIIQWALIIIGITFKSIWLRKFHWLHVVIFLLLGWSAILFFKDVYNFSHVFFYLILIGGLFYTIGVVFYALSTIKYFHFVWHIFVILGTISHSLAIIFFVYV